MGDWYVEIVVFGQIDNDNPTKIGIHVLLLNFKFEVILINDIILKPTYR